MSIQINRPTLLLNEQIVRRNIKRMADKATKNNVELIPHFKTHQSRQVGEWFREEGVKSITVSSVSMASYFAESGWKKIAIAFPVNILEIKDIAALASRVELMLLVTELQHVIALNNEVDIFVNLRIEVNTGSHRSGLDATNGENISQLIAAISNGQHRFKGFYSHFGHTYSAKSKEEVELIFKKSLNILCDLRVHFADAQPTISIGDTPSCSIIEDFRSIKSIHAGNFVFYDLMQTQIGVCNEEDIALALACPVVSKNEQREEVIIYGGGIHLSKESLYDDQLDKTIYGKIIKITESAWSSSLAACYVKSLSQEHGVLKLTPDVFKQVRIGDVIGVLPVHSCMTADCMGGYSLLSGESIDHFTGAASSKSS